MVFHREARWGKASQITWAGVHIKHLLTTPALEVVVMLMPGELEARILAGQVDCLYFTFL